METTHQAPMLLLASSHNDLGDAVPIVAIVFTFIWLTVKAVMAPFSARAAKGTPPASSPHAGLSEEEHAILLKLQRTITQMEQRVEALETILIEQRRSKENYEPKA